MSAVSRLLVAFTALVASLGWAREFQASEILGRLSLTVMLATLVAVLVARRLPVFLLAPVGAVVAMGFSTVLLFPPLDLASASDAAMNGWSRLLLSTLPAQPDPAILFVPVFATFLLAFAAVVCAERSRTPLAPMGPLLGALVVPIAFADGAWPQGLGHTAVFGVLAGASVLARARDDGALLSSARLRLTASAFVGLVVCAVFGAALAGGAPMTKAEPSSLRQFRRARLEPKASLHPLALVRYWREKVPKLDLFLAETPADGYWRLAVLDTYDGAWWGANMRFDRAGVGIQLPPEEVGVQGSLVEERISVRPGLSEQGPWLPALGRPRRVFGTDIFVDGRSGVLAGGDSFGGVYGLVSELQPERPDEKRLARASGSAARDMGVFRSKPPGIAINDMAERLTAGLTAPYEKASALESELRAFGVQSSVLDGRPLPAGHSVDVIERFLARRSGQDPQFVGTDEQFATAFALMARAVDLPSRVVVGFDDRNGREVPRSIRAAQARAWPEVAFEGFGWVKFDPTPSSDPNQAAARPRRVAQRPAVVPVQQREDKSDSSDPAEPGALPLRSEPGRSVPWARTAAIFVAVLVAFALLAVPGVKLVRRRRRSRAATPVGRVLGAWVQTTDLLTAHGASMPRSATNAEIAHVARALAGDAGASSLRDLGRLTNAALYGPESVTTEDADRAWAHHLEVRRRVRASCGRAATLRAACNPRSVLTRR